MIKVKNGVASRDPVPDFLFGLAPSALMDLKWTAASLGVRDCAWWPEVIKTTPLLEGQSYGAEHLTVNTAAKVVEISYDIAEVTDEPFMALKARYASQIDDLVATRIAKSTRFSLAYEQREAAAKAFKAANYEGDPTEWISRFANNAGMTMKQATDLILQQANGLRAALMALDSLRMDKYSVLGAASVTEMHTRYDTIVAAINAVVIP